MSPGFTDKAVSVQQVTNKDLANMRSMLFQIVPKLSYENAQELKKVQHKLATTVKNGTSMSRLTFTDKDESERLENLQQRKEAEDELNEKVILQRSGETILYGQEIQLRHAPSRMMLRAKAENADGDRSCSKLEISEFGGNGCYFKVESKYKFRRDGDRVAYGDNIFMHSVKLNLFLHYSETPIDQSRYSSFRPSTASSKYEKPTPSLFEVNLSNTQRTWKFVPYSFYRSDTAFVLKGGDIVRLYHTEKEGYLASEGVDFTEDGLPEVYVRHSKKEDDQEATCCGDLFIVEIAEKSTVMSRGSPCTWTVGDKDETEYRLRHLMTGQLLTVAEHGPNSVLSLAPHLHEMEGRQMARIADDTLIKLKPTAVDCDEFLRSSEIVKINISQKSLYLSTSIDEWLSRHNSPQGDEFEHMVDEVSKHNENIYYCRIENEELAV
eukprot:CAMPEP_0204913810 /NCGR_PEP_ID=MMETSP1397-20131031/11670_1 /ASSEMBLY_ACC=CAM_ASM_000891 /TAXON_ID=49980 /ORGANISM="Climacostomum Climacostomum virens, Strain Stock W-24" /LENGTH=436 /DNA_ID=CAMNT_0052085137 /DNA_START=12 /DNA_END=1318 /DNA_ORIENTATION=+